MMYEDSKERSWTNYVDEGKICSIEKIDHDDEDTHCYNWSGYEIITTTYVHNFTIQNGDQCCELWGCLLTNDNKEDFIGASVKDINFTTLGHLDKKKFNIDRMDDDGDEVVFINVETDRGTLQFVAYTMHNGYYGHEVKYTRNEKEGLWEIK